MSSQGPRERGPSASADRSERPLITEGAFVIPGITGRARCTDPPARPPLPGMDPRLADLPPDLLDDMTPAEHAAYLAALDEPHPPPPWWAALFIATRT